MLSSGTEKTPVWLAGASGMLAGEFARLLEGHPHFELAGAISRNPGVGLGELHPHLVTELRTGSVEGAANEILARDGEAALVLGLPHGQAADFWRDLRALLGDCAQRVNVLDLSADYRLENPSVYSEWYGREHADTEELASFVYGLPEMNRHTIEGSKRVAAPGCFATALQLATLPALNAGLLSTDSPWVYNAITGSSGSGVQPGAGTHHPHRNGNLWAYGLSGHRHVAELEQTVQAISKRNGHEIETPEICFVPHSGPFVRGIHVTALLPLAGDCEAEEAAALYADHYAADPFVEVLAEKVPDVRRVAGSNRASLHATVKGTQLLCLLTLDNVVKGGSGQALQCLNLMSGLPEETGLPIAGLGAL